jgi:hypothetical protein
MRTEGPSDRDKKQTVTLPGKTNCMNLEQTTLHSARSMMPKHMPAAPPKNLGVAYFLQAYFTML